MVYLIPTIHIQYSTGVMYIKEQYMRKAVTHSGDELGL